MDDFKDRVRAEHADISGKVEKLVAFLRTDPVLPIEDLNLLLEQHTHMIAYRDVLAERIARF